MNPLIGMLATQLGGPVMQQISQQIGADEGTTQSAVGMALPMLLSAMGNHAATPDGADAIQQATQEHDGSILDNVMGFIGNAGAGGIGSALLGQVMGGGTHNAIADTISQNTGMDNGTVIQLLMILTPLVMGAVSKTSQEQGGLDANGIAQMLGAGSGGGNDLLGMATQTILAPRGSANDADGDGNIVEDIGNVIGKIF
jgi:hypothetical protein